MRALNKFGLSLAIAVLLIGGGCQKNSGPTPGPQDSNSTTLPVQTKEDVAKTPDTPIDYGDSEQDLFNSFGWERISDPYLGISIGYPVNIYDVKLASSNADGNKWLTLTRKGSNGEIRIEIWKISDFPTKPGNPGVDYPPGYEEKTVAGQKYGIYMHLNNGDRLEEMKAITDTIK